MHSQELKLSLSNAWWKVGELTYVAEEHRNSMSVKKGYPTLKHPYVS
jgi:hypothetical protein